MTAKEFRVWQATVGLNGNEAAQALGKSKDTISAWRASGVPDNQSPIVRLACAAIAAKVEPWHAPIK